jgi:nucleoredoxin
MKQGQDYVAIYFGAHWAPPCRLFTPSLSEFYNKINNAGELGTKRLEIVFCSLDGNQQAFERNYSEMPFCAVPYEDEQRIQNLK